MGRVGAGNKMKDRCGIAVTQFAAIAHKRKGPASLSTDIRTAGPCATRSRQQDSVHTGHAGSTRAQAITARIEALQSQLRGLNFKADSTEKCFTPSLNLRVAICVQM